MFQKHWLRCGILITGLLVVALCCGCGDDETGGLPIDDVAAGWAAYQDADYEAGIASFRAAAGKASGWGETYSGIGWCYSGLANVSLLVDGDENAARDNVLLAEENFALAMTKSSALTDAWAGMALVRMGLVAYQADTEAAFDKYLGAGQAAFRAIELGQDKYVFRYDSNVNIRSLRIILAEAAFYTGDLHTAEEQVELLDLNLMLDPEDPDYVEDLLEAIGRLSLE